MLSGVNIAGDREPYDSVMYVDNGFVVGRLPPNVQAVEFLRLFHHWPMKNRRRDGALYISDTWMRYVQHVVPHFGEKNLREQEMAPLIYVVKMVRLILVPFLHLHLRYANCLQQTPLEPVGFGPRSGP